MGCVCVHPCFEILKSDKKNREEHFAVHLKVTHQCKSTIFQQNEKKKKRSSHCGSGVTNPTGIPGDVGSIPGLSQWVGDLVLP